MRQLYHAIRRSKDQLDTADLPGRKKLVDGERRGRLLGEETTAVAKPGYAVGAINTHTGLTVDGFEMVFMRIDGDRLTPPTPTLRRGSVTRKEEARAMSRAKGRSRWDCKDARERKSMVWG